MKKPRKDSERTRKNLLDAASSVFAEKGYRPATIAEICERAGANIAAVNYHFGNKKNLYRESWKQSFADLIRIYPSDGGVDSGAPPEERLRGIVTALLHRVADEKNREFPIVQKELANPTGLLREVMRKQLKPLHDRMQSVVGDILGPDVSPMQAAFCGISIISQCINPMAAKRASGNAQKNRNGPPKIEDTDAYADHVVSFSLAGMREIRETAERRRRITDNRK